MKTPAIQRLMKKVDKTESCWNWNGAKTRKGYSNILGDHGKYTSGHRISYLHFVGPIAPGLVLDHLCRNPRCVNPAHLEPVTNRENVMRGKRQHKSHCKHGHPFSPENTVIYKHPRRVAERMCWICKNARKRAYRQRQLERRAA